MCLRAESRDRRLPGGPSVRLRPLRPSDRDIYARAVIDLSPRSRYLRFLAPIERPSEKLLDAMTRVDGRRHVAFVVLSPDETKAVGVVRYVRDGDAPHEAEAAMAIADDWQGRGLGRGLLGHAVEHARQAGLHVLRATTLRENGGAERILHATGFTPVRADGPYAEHRLRLGR